MFVKMVSLNLTRLTLLQTLEMEVQVLDEEVLQNLVDYNDRLVAQGYKANQGVRLELTDPNGKRLFYGDVHPNVQYEYEATDAG